MSVQYVKHLLIVVLLTVALSFKRTTDKKYLRLLTRYRYLIIMLCFYHLGKKKIKNNKGKLNTKAATAYRQNLVISASVQKSVYSSKVYAVKRGFDKGAPPSPEDGRRWAW
jgi:hypothetical protein